MLSTLLISVREFLEAFLIIGVFLGISRRLSLKREREIIVASLVGFALSVLMPIVVFSIGDKARALLTEERADLLAGYLMIFSGCFIAYVVFSLHKFFAIKRSKTIISAHQKLQNNVFDISLFFTIVFFIIREGFEIALFTATTSLFSKFMDNLAGLVLGLAISSVLGFATFFAYMKFSIGKVFKITEYMIVMMGASFVANGVSELLEQYAHIYVSHILPLPLLFLPDHESIGGSLLNTLFGIDRDFSIAKLAIIATYIAGVYLLFLRKPHPAHQERVNP